MKKIFFLFFIMLITANFSSAQMKWYDPMDGAIPNICGRAWNSEIGGKYNRLPQRFQANMPKAVWRLSQQCAGMYIHFKTNAKTIWIRYTLTQSTLWQGNMPPLNHSGIDLYGFDKNGESHWMANQMNYQLHLKEGDTAVFKYDDILIPESGKQGLKYELFLPTYNGVKSMQIGVPENAIFSFQGQEKEKPVVIYGTSITQGAAASRPGLIWTNILKRETGIPFINLGFSGSALMESPIFEALSEINARAFIIDCIPNSFRYYNDNTIQERFPAGIKKIRSKSDAPIIIAECIVGNDQTFVSQKDAKKVKANAILKKVFKQLQDEGIKNLYYITAEDFNMPRDAMIEGTHPNDIGMMVYANTYEKALKKNGIDTKK